MTIDQELLAGLLEVHNYNTNEYLADGEYQVVQSYIYAEGTLNLIKSEMKFKDEGSMNDYPGLFTKSDTVDAFDLSANFDLYERLTFSKKFETLLFYSIERYCIRTTFIVPIKKLERFAKSIGPLLRQDNRSNIFQNIKFTKKAGEYHEIGESQGNDTKDAEAPVLKVDKENLVFSEDSTIYNVMNDISDFFTDKTQKLYEKMEISYKRGIIMYGDPGNGKSAMIREIIRKTDNVIKVVINPNVDRVTNMLASLIKALNGRKAIVIIEDIDSLITDSNRSDFLNILDGVAGRSGMYFIGTTNYPEKIDPAFMNRSGRFDRTFKIENPSEETRRHFFKSRRIGKLLSEFKTYEDDTLEDSNDNVVELFVKHSDGLPMASLKELMTSTRYLLAVNKEDISIERALKDTQEMIIGVKEDHAKNRQGFLNKVGIRKNNRNFGGAL